MIDLFQTIFAGLAFFISAIALIGSERASKQSRAFTQEDFRIRRENDIIAWGNQVIRAFCRAESLCLIPTALFSKDYFLGERANILLDFSALADIGRWYFPNIEHDKYGVTKEAAYRGLRQSILDCVVDGLDLLKEVKYDDDRRYTVQREEITTVKRRYVAEVQAQVNPRRRIAFVDNNIA